MFDIGLVIFLCWGLISVLWGANTMKSLQIYGKVVFVLFGGWLWWRIYTYFDNETKRASQKTVLIAGITLLVCLFIFVVNYKFNGTLYKIAAPDISGALIHACIACSMAIWLNLAKFSNWVKICILIITVITLQQGTSDAASLGVFLGGITLILHKYFPKFLKLTFIYGMPLVWGFIPFIFRMLTPENYQKWASTLDPSNTHRLFIWNSVTEQIFERFFTGFGFGSSRFKDFGLKSEEVSIVIDNKLQILEAPAHPHNFMLQIWLELGFIGVILGSVAWIIYWNHQYQKYDSYYIAFWASVLCVAATSISIWQSWWLFLMVTLIPIYSERTNCKFK